MKKGFLKAWNFTKAFKFGFLLKVNA